MKNFGIETQLANRTEAVNTANRFINEVAPVLAARFAEGFKIKTTSNDLYQKDARDVRSILDSAATAGKIHQSFLDITDTVIRVRVKTTFSVSPCGCCYYEEFVPVWDLENSRPWAFEPLEIVPLGKVIEAHQAIPAVEQQIRELKSKLSKLKQITGGL
ncbi:hypothetical protein F862_gp097 [Vibrio phage vB_VpaS_MAR10]|uniref:Uncharacterized protein n=1 Tax=Vibrio phage vB_VpaS_MAR10 TaxID=1229755 RepID=K7R2L4_9CAUD|nr:hypothetical protein F862_gp097 [Vibrio phage vB_VpaS_MAR10]AFV81329.1 hypothetical protein MAR10_094 [Vibrio phage vB_VpaS_MAR10]